MLRCAKCGAENSDGYHFCEQCGAALDETPSAPPPAPSAPSGPYYGPGGWMPYLPPPTSAKAIAAFILGIAGLIICPFILSIPAIVLGKIARDEIQRSQGALAGESYATAGFILGIIGASMAVLAALIIVIGISLSHAH